MMAFNPVFWILALAFALALVGLTKMFRSLRGTDR
jgi:hypothetical protein